MNAKKKHEKATELYWKVRKHKDYLPPEIRVEEEYGVCASHTRIYTPHQCVFEASFFMDVYIKRFNDGNWYDLVMEAIDRGIAEDLEDRFGAAIPI